MRIAACQLKIVELDEYCRKTGKVEIYDDTPENREIIYKKYCERPSDIYSNPRKEDSRRHNISDRIIKEVCLNREEFLGGKKTFSKLKFELRKDFDGSSFIFVSDKKECNKNCLIIFDEGFVYSNVLYAEQGEVE